MTSTEQALAEARILSMASPTLIPMLEERRRVALQRLIALFREGKNDYTALVAELSTIEAIEREFKVKSEWYSEKMKENQK